MTQKYYNCMNLQKMSIFFSCRVINAYLSLSISLTFLFARHCLTIIKRVEALEGVRPAENRSARGRRRTRQKLSLGSCGERKNEWTYYIKSSTAFHIICVLSYLILRAAYTPSWRCHKGLPALLQHKGISELIFSSLFTTLLDRISGKEIFIILFDLFRNLCHHSVPCGAVQYHKPSARGHWRLYNSSCHLVAKLVSDKGGDQNYWSEMFGPLSRHQLLFLFFTRYSFSLMKKLSSILPYL